MSEMSDYLEDTLIGFLFRTLAFSKPTAIYIGLATATIVDSDTGTSITEASGGSYARVARAPLDANWTATSGGDGQTDNAAAITFTQATADWSAGSNMTDVAITDAATLGNLWLYSPLTVAKPVLNGDTAEFAAGALTITFA